MGRIFPRSDFSGSWRKSCPSVRKTFRTNGKDFLQYPEKWDPKSMAQSLPQAIFKNPYQFLSNSCQNPSKSVHILPIISKPFKILPECKFSKIWPESFPYPSNVQTPSKPFHNPQSRFLSNSFPTPKSFQNLAKFLPKSFQNPSSQSFAHLKLIKNNILPDSFPPKSCQHPLKITKIPKPPNPNSQPSALRFQSAISNPRPWYLKTTNDDAPRVCQI